MTDLKKTLAELDRLSARQDALREELRKSLAVQEFMPDAFAYGSCKIGGRATESEPEKGTVIFTLGNGEKREFTAAEVPIELWPAQMRQDLHDRKDRLHRRARA